MELPTVTIGVPHNGDFTSEFIVSLFGLVFQSKASCKLNLFESCLVHKSRNQIFESCYDDYLLFIDTDMAFPPDALDKLIALDKDIAGAVYFSRKIPHKPMVMDLTGDSKFQFIDQIPDKPFKCDAIGTGFMLIKKKVIEKFDEEIMSGRLKEFPFDFPARREDKVEIGEDIAFCKRATEMGFEVWCDPSITMGHVAKVVVTKEYFDAYKDVQDTKRN